MSESLNLFSEIQLGDIRLNNRALMAPLTRCRATGDMPNALMAHYYRQRVGAGLIIAEATAVTPGCVGFMNGPGIYTQAHSDAWRQVTDAVHQEGGKIFLQLWHGGRACHPDLNDGAVPVAASAIAISNSEAHTPTGHQPYTVPRPLTIAEIDGIVASFKQAAIYAQEAGFDGVEIHGANGYLLDNFLRDGSNQRTDQYGGSIENRARLLMQVLHAVIDVWGAGKVGLRTSPLNSFNSMTDSDPVALTTWLAKALTPLNLAYWHLMRGDILQQQSGDIMTPARTHYQGNIIGNMGYGLEEANSAIAAQTLDAIAFGVPFLANPDLVERFVQNSPLNEANRDTFYLGGEKGYTDYPTLAATLESA